MANVEAQLARLEATMKTEFGSVHRRVDDFSASLDRRMDRIEEVQADRHDENKEHMQKIEDKQDLTNGNVMRHEEQIRSLFKRFHEFVSGRPALAKSSLDPEEKDDEKRSYTKRDITIFLAGGGALIGAYKFIEWAVAHLPKVQP